MNATTSASLLLRAGRDPLAAQLAAALARECRRPAGAPTGVALSGGADSTALLVLMAAVARREKPAPTLIAFHVHHHLRPEADAEAQQCASLCARLNLPLVVRHVHPSRGRGGLAERARRVRHEALEEAAIGAGVEWILMAHHADDVLETLLMRLGRGVASRGLSGIPWVRRGWRSRTVRVARPLLLATHSELRALCDRLGVPHSRDPGNVSPLSARGVLRRSVTGPLRERWSGVAKHAARAADASRAGAWALRELARRDGWSSESIPRSAFRTAGAMRAAALLICGVRIRGMELAPAAARRIAETACDASSEPRSVESKGAHATIGARTVRITATRGQVH